MLVLLSERTPPSGQRSASEDDPLPGYQGPARVTLLVIDPYLVHAYWDLDTATLPQASHGLLRVYDTTGETSSYFDVPVSLQARNWYIQLWTPERCYYAELGFSEEGGRFTLLARSNTVQTPRAWPAVAVEQWDEPAAPAPVESLEAAPQEPLESAPVPLPPVAAQQPDSVLQPDGVLQPDTVLQPENLSQPDRVLQSDSAIPSRDRQEAVFPPPPIPEPVDAPKMLRTRLEQVYASLRWMQRPGAAAESPAPGNASNPSPAAHPNKPGDLTQRAEEHFSAGVSSRTPKPPA